MDKGKQGKKRTTGRKKIRHSQVRNITDILFNRLLNDRCHHLDGHDQSHINTRQFMKPYEASKVIFKEENSN